MELIDREKLLNELGESASYHAENGREYQLLLRDRNIVREQKEVKAIPLDKVKQAVEEIGNLEVYHSTLIDGKKTLEILDKLIAESEGK